MQTCSNPLISPVLEVLRDHPEGISEYNLLRSLQTRKPTADLIDFSSNLALFRTHFLLMNALYQLQDSLTSEGWLLSISALSIRLLPLASSGQTSLSVTTVESKLRAYYLDWTEFERTDADTVEALLRGFWERLLADDRRQQAYADLGLDAGATWEQVRLKYQRLASELHPDKGGNAERFIAVRSAFEVLRQVQKFR